MTTQEWAEQSDYLERLDLRRAAAAETDFEIAREDERNTPTTPDSAPHSTTSVHPQPLSGGFLSDAEFSERLRELEATFEREMRAITSRFVEALKNL